ncbi:hypothetical protein ACOZE4_00575 [Streptomyces griseoincarnatus]
MDEGNAAVIAAALGIAGTLFGSLGGAMVAARATRKQVRDQEGAEHRHWLRQERQTAYAALLDACRRGMEIIRVHLSSGDEYLNDAVALEILSAALEARTVVAIVGPPDMDIKARELAECFVDTINSRRDMVQSDGVVNSEDRDFGRHFTRLDAARSAFVDGARDVLTKQIR